MVVRHSRRGLTLPVVCGILGTLAAFVWFLFASWRARTQQVHLHTDAVAARWMARGALECVRFAVTSALEKPTSLTPSLGTGSLTGVLLNDPKGFERQFALGVSARYDARRFVEGPLGWETFRPIDALLAKHEEARMKIRFLGASAGPLYPTTHGLVDPILKRAALDIAVDCSVGRAHETYEGSFGVHVTSALPYITSRFTLTALDVDGQAIDGIAVDPRGRPAADGPAPVLLFHAPADLPDKQEPLEDTADGARPLVQSNSITTMDQAQKVLADRGAVYLSPRDPQTRVVLRLASGGAPLGQYYQVYASTDGVTHYPHAQALTAQPSALSDFHPREPDIVFWRKDPGPGHSRTDPPPETAQGSGQSALVQGAVFGYYNGIDDLPWPRDNGLLGAPAQDETSGVGTPILRLMGTASHPSPALVYGPVYAGLAGISDLAVRRDAAGQDEEGQSVAARGSPQARNSIDPFLRNVSESEFASDVTHEGGRGGCSYDFLLPFRSPDLPCGYVHNLKAFAGTSGEGPGPAATSSGTSPNPIRLDMEQAGRFDSFEAYTRYARELSRRITVSSEALHEPLGLDTSQYRYGRIFPHYTDYSRVMSRRLTIPVNALLELASLDPQEAAAQLERTAFGGDDAPAYAGEVLSEARMLHTDPVHVFLARSTCTRAYVDTTSKDSLPLDQAVRMFATHFDQRGRDLYGAADFRTLYTRGKMLDLERTHVVIKRVKPRVEVLLDLGIVNVAPRGGGVLDVDTLRARRILNESHDGDFVPLIIRAKHVILDGEGPFEAVFVLQEPPQLVGVATHTVIRGAVIANRGALEGLSRPLAIVYDPRLDPIGPHAHLHYEFQMAPPERPAEALSAPSGDGHMLSPAGAAYFVHREGEKGRS